LSPAQLIEAHAAPRYEVACLGFLPGFAYLLGLPKTLHLPRRELAVLELLLRRAGRVVLRETIESAGAEFFRPDQRTHRCLRARPRGRAIRHCPSPRQME